MTLNLNCANFYDEGRNSLAFPPKGLKKHPQDLNKASIRKAIKKGADKLVIPAHNTDNRDLAIKVANANKNKPKTTVEQEKAN